MSNNDPSKLSRIQRVLNPTTAAWNSRRKRSRIGTRANATGPRMFRQEVLPPMFGLIAFIFIVAWAMVLLGDGIVGYLLLAITGLVGIYIISSGNNTPVHEGFLGLSRVSVEYAMYSLNQIAEARDQESPGHSERVAGNSVAIGRELGLSQTDLNQLWWAGLLHDAGKIRVSESILKESTPLNEEEWREVEKHTEYGAQIFFGFCSTLPAVRDAIRFHHERWDGRGYPLGLRGNEIPLFARIVALADALEALTALHPSRSVMTPLQACSYIMRESGQHFDPALVNVFDALYRKGALLLADSDEAVTQANNRIRKVVT